MSPGHLRSHPGAGGRRGEVEAELLLLDVVHEVPLVGEGPVVVPGELVQLETAGLADEEGVLEQIDQRLKRQLAGQHRRQGRPSPPGCGGYGREYFCFSSVLDLRPPLCPPRAMRAWVRGSRSRMVRSSLPVTSQRPSGLIATARTLPEWPRSSTAASAGFPAFRSQSRVVPSRPAVASHLLSELNAADKT